jgi:hypothetical protein
MTDSRNGHHHQATDTQSQIEGHIDNIRRFHKAHAAGDLKAEDIATPKEIGTSPHRPFALIRSLIDNVVEFTRQNPKASRQLTVAVLDTLLSGVAATLGVSLKTVLQQPPDRLRPGRRHLQVEGLPHRGPR